MRTWWNPRDFVILWRFVRRCVRNELLQELHWRLVKRNLPTINESTEPKVLRPLNYVVLKKSLIELSNPSWENLKNFKLITCCKSKTSRNLTAFQQTFKNSNSWRTHHTVAWRTLYTTNPMFSMLWSQVLSWITLQVIIVNLSYK